MKHPERACVTAWARQKDIAWRGLDASEDGVAASGSDADTCHAVKDR